MMLNFTCRLDWVMGCLDICLLVTCGVFVGEFLDEPRVAAGGSGEAHGPPNVLKV